MATTTNLLSHHWQTKLMMITMIQCSLITRSTNAFSVTEASYKLSVRPSAAVGDEMYDYESDRVDIGFTATAKDGDERREVEI